MPPSRDHIHREKKIQREPKGRIKQPFPFEFGAYELSDLQNGLGNQGMIALLQQMETPASPQQTIHRSPENPAGASDKNDAADISKITSKYVPDYNFRSGTDRNDPKYIMPANVYTDPETGTDFVFPAEYDPKNQEMTPERAIMLYRRLPERLREQGQKEIQFVDYANPGDQSMRTDSPQHDVAYANYMWDAIRFNGKKDRLPPQNEEAKRIREKNDSNPQHDDDFVLAAYCHEMGHKIDIAQAEPVYPDYEGDGHSPEPNPPANVQPPDFLNSGEPQNYSGQSKWIDAVKADNKVCGKLSPTSYGETNLSEDFAESVSEYTIGYEHGDAFAIKFPNRAALLKEIVGMTMKEAEEKKKVAAKSKAAANFSPFLPIR